MTTLEQKLQQIIGAQAFQIAVLQTELEVLRAKESSVPSDNEDETDE